MSAYPQPNHGANPLSNPKPKRTGLIVGIVVGAIVVIVVVAIVVVQLVTASADREAQKKRLDGASARAQELLEDVLDGGDRTYPSLVPVRAGLPGLDASLLGGKGAEASLGENLTASILSAAEENKVVKIQAQVSGSLAKVPVTVIFTRTGGDPNIWAPEELAFPKVQLSEGELPPDSFDVKTTQFNGVDVSIKDEKQAFLMWPGPAHFTAKDSKANVVQDSDLGVLDNDALASPAAGAKTNLELSFAPGANEARVRGLVEIKLQEMLDKFKERSQFSSITDAIKHEIPGTDSFEFGPGDKARPELRNLSVVSINVPELKIQNFDPTSANQTEQFQGPHFDAAGIRITIKGQWKNGEKWDSFQITPDSLRTYSGRVDLANNYVKFDDPNNLY